jgi:hypothetical protein
MVDSNIWMRCAVELMDASVSKNTSKTPALLKRSKRFQEATGLYLEQVQESVKERTSLASDYNFGARDYVCVLGTA